MRGIVRKVDAQLTNSSQTVKGRYTQIKLLYANGTKCVRKVHENQVLERNVYEQCTEMVLRSLDKKNIQGDVPTVL